MGEFILRSCVLLVEGVSLADISKSRDCKTRGKRIQANGLLFLYWLTMVPPSIIALITSAAILSKRPSPHAAQSTSLPPTMLA